MHLNQARVAPGNCRPLLLGALVALLLTTTGAAYAQSGNTGTSGASVDLAAEIQVAPGGETTLPLAIREPIGGTGTVIMLIRGLPADVSVSEGRIFGQGVWAVPLASASRLKLRPAASAGGVSEISVALVTREGVKLAEAVAVLRIVPGAQAPSQRQIQITAQQQTASLQPRAVGKPDAGQSASAAAPVRLTPAEEEQLNRMVLRGNESMQTGKVAAARLFYQRAAESGSATGALALAGTYDAGELAKRDIVGGVHADAKLARQWYAKAKELGSAEAARRLQQLGER